MSNGAPGRKQNEGIKEQPDRSSEVRMAEMVGESKRRTRSPESESCLATVTGEYDSTGGEF